jgi:hypothetical protein
MSANARVDFVEYLNENKLHKFDQFQWDMLMAESFIVTDTNTQQDLSNKRGDKCDKCNLISYAIYNGGKLYKPVFAYFLSKKRYDLLEKILSLPDIFTNEISSDYLVTVFAADRHYNIHSTNLLDNIQYGGLSVITSAFSGCITPDNLLFCACQTGNTDYLARALTLGANSYKTGIYLAKKNGYDDIAETLMTTWKSETKKEIKLAADTVTNSVNSWVDSFKNTLSLL